MLDLTLEEVVLVFNENSYGKNAKYLCVHKAEELLDMQRFRCLRKRHKHLDIMFEAFRMSFLSIRSRTRSSAGSGCIATGTSTETNIS